MSAHWDFNMNIFGGWVEVWGTNIQTIATSVLEGREGLLVQLFIFQVLTLMWPYVQIKTWMCLLLSQPPRNLAPSENTSLNPVEPSCLLVSLSVLVHGWKCTTHGWKVKWQLRKDAGFYQVCVGDPQDLPHHMWNHWWMTSCGIKAANNWEEKIDERWFLK